jgi:predicted restriction endonuclease
MTNGLLLRRHLHTLFDLNKITIDKNYRVMVAPELKATVYGRLQAKATASSRQVQVAG